MTQDTDNDALKQSLIRAGLVPGPAEDLLRDFEPTINLEVSYAGKPVELGTLFRASECEVAPAISFAPEVCNRIYPLNSYLVEYPPTDSITARAMMLGPEPHIH